MTNAFSELTSKQFMERYIRKGSLPLTPNKRNKYMNVKVEVNGKKYDSKKEAARGFILEERQREGKISQLERQKQFMLIEGFEYYGKRIRGTQYIADFYYYDEENKEWVVEDVKSYITRKKPEYRIKIKLFMLKYPKIHFQEIM